MSEQQSESDIYRIDNYHIDLSAQPNGIYFLIANINKQRQAMKIIKMQETSFYSIVSGETPDTTEKIKSIPE